MTKDFIIVGAGEYWGNSIMPCLPVLQNAGVINNVTTIDVTNRKLGENVPHVLRTKDQPLSRVVDKIGYEKPIVLLSHANQLHAPEAVELMQNSQSQPKLLIEKPYAINASDTTQLTKLLNEHAGDIGLLEYYLTMKAAPLLIFAGTIKKDSFYFENNGVLKALSLEATLRDYYGKLYDKIGDPLHVVSEVLEGEETVGTVEQRNISITDKRLGGGMLQDLGLHAIAPLRGLENYLGKITTQSVRDVRIAFCNEYKAAAIERGVPDNEIGESYAEIDLETSSRIPTHIFLGKYVEAGKNQRRILIVGTRGIVLQDQTNCTLFYQCGDNTQLVSAIQADKGVSVPKYLAVLRAGLAAVEGKNPFTFDPIAVAWGTQKIILAAIDREPSQIASYRRGAIHDTIFK